jgi:hypothetical protein
MNPDILLNQYLELKTESKKLQKEQLVIKKDLKALEVSIMEYFLESGIDSIMVNNCQISIFEKKVNQTFKKESILEILKNKLPQYNENQTEQLTDAIINNKKFTTVDMIKVKIPDIPS